MLGQFQKEPFVFFAGADAKAQVNPPDLWGGLCWFWAPFWNLKQRETEGWG